MNKRVLPHAHGLLILLVPIAHDHHEHGADTTFEETKEETLSEECLVVEASGRKDEADTPKGDDDGSNALDGVSLSENNGTTAG